MGFKKKIANSCGVAVSLCLLVSSGVMAANSGIKHSLEEDCSIWLCLPAGFGPGCEIARQTFISRVTDVDKKGRMRWTEMPAFNHCVVSSENETQVDQFSYSTDSLAYIPKHQICTRLENLRYGSYPNQVIKKRCVAWETIPERYEPGACRTGAYRYDDFNQIIGSKARPAFCVKTVRKTTVYGNGQQYGNSWIW